MSTAAAVSAATAGVAAALVCRPAPARVLARIGAAGSPVSDAPPGAGARLGRVARPAASAPVVAGAVLVAAVATAAVGPRGILLGAALALVLVGLAWSSSASRRRRAVEHGRRRVVEACDALAAELRAGQPAGRALSRAAEHHPVLAAAARTARLGGDVATALRAAATPPGGGGLATVAAAWQVAEATGSGLASALERVCAGLRAEAATRAEVAAALAPARATARLLAVLPVFGLLLGGGIGGDPVDLLLGTGAGNALLLAGVGLACAGTAWVERLARGAEP